MIRRFGWLTIVMALGLTLLLAVGCGQGTSPPTAMREPPAPTPMPPTRTPNPPTPTPVPPTPMPEPPTPTPTLVPMPQSEQQPPLPSADYYPMAVGDYWVLRWTDPDGSTWQRTEAVTGTRQMDWATVFVVRRELSTQPGEYSEQYRSVRGGNVYWHGSDSYEDGTLVETSRPIDGPEVFWEMPFQIGSETWTTSSTRVTEADGGMYTYDEEYHDVVEAMESVDVPAGHFEDCYRIRDTWTSEPNFDITLIWLCPGVGQTRMRLVDSSYEDDIGLLVELIEYRVD